MWPMGLWFMNKMPIYWRINQDIQNDHDRKSRLIKGTFIYRLLTMICIRPKYIWAVTWQNQQNECAPNEDSDQPGHQPSLIRVFAVRMKKAWVLSYHDWAHSEDSDQTGQMPRLIWIFAGRTDIFWFVMSRLSYVQYVSGFISNGRSK